MGRKDQESFCRLLENGDTYRPLTYLKRIYDPLFTFMTGTFGQVCKPIDKNQALEVNRLKDIDVSFFAQNQKCYPHLSSRQSHLRTHSLPCSKVFFILYTMRYNKGIVRINILEARAKIQNASFFRPLEF